MGFEPQVRFRQLAGLRMIRADTATTVSADYRARYYDPTTGRFLSEDPIQFVSGRDFSVYVRNSPNANGNTTKDNLPASTLFSLGMEFSMPGHCPAPLPFLRLAGCPAHSHSVRMSRTFDSTKTLDRRRLDLECPFLKSSGRTALAGEWPLRQAGLPGEL